MNTLITKEGATVYYSFRGYYLLVVIPVKNVEDSIQVEISNKVSSSHEMVYKIFSKHEAMDLSNFPPKYSSLKNYNREIQLTSQKKKLVKIVGWPTTLLHLAAIKPLETAMEAIALWNKNQAGYLAVDYIWASIETDDLDNRIQVMSVVWTDEGIAMKKNLGLFK